MLRETIQFKDFNDQDRTETLYFHLSESEIVDIVAATPEGIDKQLQDALLSNNAQMVLDEIKKFVHLSYGIKSQDGLQFNKSPEILARFVASPYYSDFLLGLIQDDGKKGEQFMRDILPPKLLERAEAKVRGEVTAPIDSHYAPGAREQFAQNRPPVADRLAPKSPQTRVTDEQPIVNGSNSSDDYNEFLAWKASQARNESQVMPDPPHEQVG